jgi:hypothetical protein
MEEKSEMYYNGLAPEFSREYISGAAMYGNLR